MQQAQDNKDKKTVNRIGLIFLLLGGLATLIVCGMISVGIFLDVAGAEAPGEMTNISYDEARSDNPFTPQITFTTADGEKVSFIAWQGMTPFIINDFVRFGSDTAPTSAELTVRYLESYPKIAKITLAYHAEYLNRINWLFWSGVALMIGIITRRNKPIVIDLSQRKN